MWPSKCTDRSLSIITSCQLVDKKLAVLDFFGRQKESVLYTPSLFANVGLTGNCKYKTATSQRHAMKYPASLQSTHNPTAQSWVNSWSYNYNSTGELNVRSHRKRSAARRRRNASCVHAGTITVCCAILREELIGTSSAVGYSIKTHFDNKATAAGAPSLSDGADSTTSNIAPFVYHCHVT